MIHMEWNQKDLIRKLEDMNSKSKHKKLVKKLQSKVENLKKD